MIFQPCIQPITFHLLTSYKSFSSASDTYTVIKAACNKLKGVSVLLYKSFTCCPSHCLFNNLQERRCNQRWKSAPTKKPKLIWLQGISGKKIVENLDKPISLAMWRSEIHLAESSAKGPKLESLHGRTGSSTSRRMSTVLRHMGCARHTPTGIASVSVLVL